jgi:choline dehydrogenase-like flavoprotein
MANPFVPRDDTHRSYHSGATGRLVRRPEAIALYKREVAAVSFTFETGKYRPPFTVTVRTSVDGWSQDHTGDFRNGRWEFALSGAGYDNQLEMKFRLDGVFWMRGGNVTVYPDERHRYFTDGDVFFAYEVRFGTNLWRPGHLITLRNDAGGWGRDVYGVFRDDAWYFDLDRAEHPAALAAKLVLERSWFMNGANLAITSAQEDYPLSDADVQFPASPPAYRHGYDNYLPVNTPLEQITVRSAGVEAEEYPVLIVGSGMAGGALANELSNRGARTLVLDAGGLWFPEHMNELPGSEVDLAKRDMLGHFVNLPGSNLLFGVHFSLGGRSAYWSGVIPRMRTWEMRGAWPESVRSYLFEPGPGGHTGYERAERLMRRGKTLGPYQDRLREYLREALGEDFHVHDLPRSLHQPYVDAHGHLRNILEKPTGVYSTADLLLDSLGFSGQAGRTDLRVNLHQLATRVETAGRRATAVVCQDLVGNVERRYRGRYVVLCCGSLESAKLAINSGLTDRNNKMGKGLTDHPTYFYNIHHELPREGSLGWVGNPHGHAKILIQRRGATASEHPYNIELLINGKFWDARHADDALWRQLLESDPVSRVEIKFIFGSPLDDGNSITPRGPGEKPEVFVRPNLTGSESRYKEEVLEVRNRVLGALGVENLSTTWVPQEWGEGRDGTVHHAGGTLRMAADGSGVVDETLKFLDYDNLYCCDVSVFPTIPAANPSLTLTALALRLADTLAARLGLP